MKGKIEINKGDILLLPFPFTDHSSSKLRPSLVIGIDASDITVVFITSKVDNKDYVITVNPSDTNGIKLKSYIRYSKLATLDHKLSVGRLGKLEKETYAEVIEKIYKFVK